MSQLPDLTQAQKQAYFNRMLPWAQKARDLIQQASGSTLPVSDILAEWADESWYGTSDIAVYGNNHGGIKYTANSQYDDWQSSGGYAQYSTLDHFVQDYARVWGLSYYKAARDVPDTDPVKTAQEMGASPYAEGHYGGTSNPGADLVSIIHAHNLTQYDTAATVPPVDGMSKSQLMTYAAAALAVIAVVGGLNK